MFSELPFVLSLFLSEDGLVLAIRLLLCMGACRPCSTVAWTNKTSLQHRRHPHQALYPTSNVTTVCCSLDPPSANHKFGVLSSSLPCTPMGFGIGLTVDGWIQYISVIFPLLEMLLRHKCSHTSGVCHHMCRWNDYRFVLLIRKLRDKFLTFAELCSPI